MRQPIPIGRDTELTVRMSLTMLMLAMVFVAFMGLLFWAGVPWFFVLVIAIVMAMFQYWGSDRMVLMTTGAKEVTEEQEPWLHQTVARLAQAAEIPKPKRSRSWTLTCPMHSRLGETRKTPWSRSLAACWTV